MNWKQFTTFAYTHQIRDALWIINKVNELKAIHNEAIKRMHSSGLWIINKVNELKAIHNKVEIV